LAFEQRTKALVAAQDITPLKRAEQETARGQGFAGSGGGGKNCFAQGSSPRVKNNLAVISSLLNMKAEITDDGPAKVALEDSSGACTPSR